MSRLNKLKLSLIYDKRQKDFVVKYPFRCDGNLVMNHIVGDILKWRIPNREKQEYPFNFDTNNFTKELDKRGYDITTLKFSIELKKDYERK